MHHEQAIDPFSSGAITTFRRQVRFVLRDLEWEGSSAFLDDTDRALREEAESALPGLATLIERIGLRRQWNSLLSRDRAEVIASWVAPHLRGRVLDLLSGCGSVGRLLERAGWDVIKAERTDDYTAYLGKGAPVDLPFVDDEEPLASCWADTVLLCAVLHHEEDPAWLVAQATKVGARRLVIVENCIEEDLDEEFHVLMDIFFNHCLNRIDIDIPAEHRTIGEWLEFLGRFGPTRMVDRRSSLPGVPLGHHLFVVDLVPRSSSR